MRKGWKRIHRLVVLPDYQGIGIGTKFIKEVAKIIDKEGYNVNLTTTTPSLVHALKKDKNWCLIRYGRVKGKMDFSRYGGDCSRETKNLDGASSGRRITYSFNFIKD